MLEDLPFQPPPSWRQRTLFAFVEPAVEAHNPASIVVAREALREGATLQALADELLLELRELPAFHSLGRRTLEVNGDQAVELRYEWVSDDGPIQQSSTFIETSNASGRLLTNITTTCAKKDAEEKAPLFAQFFGERPAPRISAVVPKPDACDELTLPNIPIPGTVPARVARVSDPRLPAPPPLPYIPMPGSRERR